MKEQRNKGMEEQRKGGRNGGMKEWRNEGMEVGGRKNKRKAQPHFLN